MSLARRLIEAAIGGSLNEDVDMYAVRYNGEKRGDTYYFRDIHDRDGFVQNVEADGYQTDEFDGAPEDGTSGVTPLFSVKVHARSQVQ